MSAPSFVVVGHVNRGKSSVVSTLAADESVRIGDIPGTTRECRAYPMRIGDEVLYTLIDTPGFERPRQALAWLREREGATADRRQLVSDFVAAHRGGDAFAQECELLEPILAGGAILYVIDASIPFSPAAEAEAEILRFTGQPRMALLNRIGDRDQSDAWRPVLDQYFSLVRDFDAHDADFRARIDLLRALRELSEGARGDLDRAIEALQADRLARAKESAALIADALVSILSHREEERLPQGAAPDAHRGALEDRYFEGLREQERRLHRDLRQVYRLDALVVEEDDDAPPVADDLFDTDTWSRLGLSRKQLLLTGAAAGALAGGGLDLAVGGASLMLGAALGSAAGLGSTWWAWNRLAETEILGQPLGGVLLRVGPMRNPNFPWVLFDRALLVHRAIKDRAHAHREPLRLSERRSRVVELSGSERRRFQTFFDRCRKQSPVELGAARLELSDALEALVADETVDG